MEKGTLHLGNDNELTFYLLLLSNNNFWVLDSVAQTSVKLTQTITSFEFFNGWLLIVIFSRS